MLDGVLKSTLQTYLEQRRRGFLNVNKWMWVSVPRLLSHVFLWIPS